MEKNFISYKLAVLVKEKGFNQRCFSSYDDDKKLRDTYSTTRLYNESPEDIIGAPLYQQITDWFRNYHQINMNIYPELRRWNINIYSFKKGDCLLHIDNIRSYYKAMDRGIEETLKFIKK